MRNFIMCTPYQTILVSNQGGLDKQDVQQVRRGKCIQNAVRKPEEETHT
jgi:hypothetical protein